MKDWHELSLILVPRILHEKFVSIAKVKVFGKLTQVRKIFDSRGQGMTLDCHVKCPIGCQRSRKDLSWNSVSSERNSLEVQTRNWSMSDREVETSENMLTNRPCLKSIQYNIFRSSQIGGFSNTDATFEHLKIFRRSRESTDRKAIFLRMNRHPY